MKRTLILTVLVTLLTTTLSAQTIAQLATTANASGPYAGSFDTLLAAVTCTGLVTPLATPKKQYTVFAPTDDAFAALGLDASNVCSAFTNDVLTSILLYHVAPGRRLAADVLDGENVRTLSKSFVYPYAMGADAYIRDNSALTDDAMVIVPNLEASNGVIHVIDGVLLP